MSPKGSATILQNLRGNARSVKSFAEWSIKRIQGCCSPVWGDWEARSSLALRPACVFNVMNVWVGGLSGIPLRLALEHKFATSLPAASTEGWAPLPSVSTDLPHLSPSLYPSWWMTGRERWSVCIIMAVGLDLLLCWQKDWKLPLADMNKLASDYATICSGGLAEFSINTHFNKYLHHIFSLSYFFFLGFWVFWKLSGLVIQ